MKYENITPDYFVERVFCKQICDNLSEKIDDDVLFLVRGWEQPPPFPQQKYISIVTSAEGHQYIPPEREDPHCLGVFMHYYPKTSLEHQYNPSKDTFAKLDNVYPLPLGTTKFFTGDSHIPLLDRTINVSFVGQLDPYRRMDFFNEIGRAANEIEGSVFHFYEGWNKGIGSKYSEIMSNTKIALVPCGSASLDTFRFYEAAQSGCVIMSYLQNEYEFMNKCPVIQTPKWDGLARAVNYLLRNKKVIEAASEKVKEFWEKKLSPRGAAKFIYKKLKTKGVV